MSTEGPPLNAEVLVDALEKRDVGNVGGAIGVGWADKDVLVERGIWTGCGGQLSEGDLIGDRQHACGYGCVHIFT